jgi:hypothetical protein
MISSWLRCDLVNFLPGLVSNCEPPDLSLPSSYDYSLESLAPSWVFEELQGNKKDQSSKEMGRVVRCEIRKIAVPDSMEFSRPQ